MNVYCLMVFNYYQLHMFVCTSICLTRIVHLRYVYYIKRYYYYTYTNTLCMYVKLASYLIL